jgi:hypothetical protein
LIRVAIPAERGRARELLDRGHKEALVTEGLRSCSCPVEIGGNLCCYAAVQASCGQSDPCT